MPYWFNYVYFSNIYNHVGWITDRSDSWTYSKCCGILQLDHPTHCLLM
jgi:hypothetical protein